MPAFEAPRPFSPGPPAWPGSPARPRRARRLVVVISVVLLAVVLGGGAGLVVMRRLRTGTWQAPSVADLVVLGRRLTGEPSPPSRIIYLDGAARTITPGEDDARRGVSSVVAQTAGKVRQVPGWKGSNKAWADTVACVRGIFAPYAVDVTDQPPATAEHLLVAVGGKPADIGVNDRRVAGMAPFSGEPIPRAVVFAFAAAQGHRPRAVCETIAMEVAHAYGLDHEYLCSDVMSYLPPCGKRKFVDRDVACGETKKRPCGGGAPTQNSHRRLLSVLGPGRVALR